MALTVTPLLSDISLAESTTGWSTGALDPDFYKQGSNSIGFYMSKNARGSITYTPGTSISWSAYTYAHLYFWANSSVAAKMEAKSTGTTTASGVTVRVTLSNNAYREWHVAGSDTWDGGWEKCFIIDMSHTGTQLYASSGTFSSASNIASVTWYFDLSNSGNIRNVPANTWLDAVRVGEGLRVHNTSAADPSFDFGSIAAVDENVSNQYGVLRTLENGAEGAYGAQGKIQIGDSAGSNHCDFNSTDETLVFLERDGSGYGLVNANLYSLDFVGNATGTDQDVTLGVKVGTGTDTRGRNGSQIRAGGTTVSYSVDMSNANLHNVGWYGSTIQGADGGVSATGLPTTTFEIGGTTFDGCEQVDTRDAVVRNSFFQNTVAPSTSGALLWDVSEVDVSHCFFINNTVGVQIPTASSSISFTGMEFSSNTNDVRYEGSGSYNLNWSDASAAPSIQNAGAGTLTAVNSVTITLTGLPNNVEVRIYQDAGSGVAGAEIAGIENVTGNQFAYTDAASNNVIITIFDEDYNPVRTQYQNPSSSTSIPIQLISDGWYLNPQE